MGVRLASAATTTIINASIANGVEGIVATTGIIGLAQDNAQVIILCMVDFNVGAAATGVSWRLRRGAAATGTLVNVQLTDAIVASTVNRQSLVYVDSPGVVGGAQYTLTGSVGGGAAALTFNDVCLVVIVL